MKIDYLYESGPFGSYKNKRSKTDAIKMEVHLMSLSREEEFLKTLKELQKILN